jgi:hypothetical protein
MIKNISMAAIAAALLLSSCGSPSGSGIGSSFDATFTVKDINRFGSTDDAIISSISNILVASDGTTIVTDGRAPVVFVYDADGTFQGTVGDIGRGPGEFDTPPTVSLFENDSLFAFDRGLQRASIFARNGFSWNYVRSIPFNTQLEDGYDIGAIAKLIDVDGYITTDNVGFTAGTDRKPEDTYTRYRVIAEDGTELKSNYIKRRISEFVIESGSDFVTLRTLPFGRNSFVRIERGGNYYLGEWNDKLKIDHFAFDGTRLGGIDVPVAERTITDSDKTLDPRSAEPAVADKIPATHPAYVSFLVSDKGNYWVNIGQIDANNTYWVVISPDSEILGTTLLPASVRPVRIVDGKMYAANQSSSVEPEVVVLKVDF